MVTTIRPATPTKPAAIAPTTIDVLVPPVADGVGVGVAEDATLLLVRGRKLVLVNAGSTLLVGIIKGAKDCVKIM